MKFLTDYTYMPRSIFVLLIQFMLLLLCCILSNEFLGFSNLPLSNIIFI